MLTVLEIESFQIFAAVHKSDILSSAAKIMFSFLSPNLSAYVLEIESFQIFTAVHKIWCFSSAAKVYFSILSPNLSTYLIWVLTHKLQKSYSHILRHFLYSSKSPTNKLSTTKLQWIHFLFLNSFAGFPPTTDMELTSLTTTLPELTTAPLPINLQLGSINTQVSDLGFKPFEHTL